jgi:hypothetical protein
MQLDEIVFSTVDKQVSIDQRDYQSRKAQLLKHRLPFTIDVVMKDGRAVSIAVTMTRDGGTLDVHLIDEDAGRFIGKLILSSPGYFASAYYVESMMIVPAYQYLGIGATLYYNLLLKRGISFIGIDQSLGARKMWGRLSRMQGVALYAVNPTPRGNMFYHCVTAGEAGYAYITYDDKKKPVQDKSSLHVILTKKSSKMDVYVTQHINLMQEKLQLSQGSAPSLPTTSEIQL